MSPPKGYITHDALVATTGNASLTFSTGSDSTFGTIEARPDDTFVSAVGTTQVRYGNGYTRTFRGVAIEQQTKPSNAAGTRVVFHLRHRMWQWEEGGGRISGWYNRRKPNGEIISDSEKTPRQLAQLCIDAIGESISGVGSIRNDERPEIVWDYVKPLDALREILRLTGCRIAYRMDDTYRIVRSGVGAQLPQQHRQDPPDIGTGNVARPDSLLFVGGRSLWELTFELEAVGRDVDGFDSIKPIDDLSYKPDDKDWGDMLPDFLDIAADPQNPTDAEKKAIKYARESVFKWFRIKNLATRDLRLPQFPVPGETTEIDDVDQILLRSVLIDTEQDDKGNERPIPAYVEGEFLYEPADNRAVSVNTKPGTRYKGGISIDAESQLVKFSDVVTLRKDGVDDVGKLKPKLYLRTSCWIRENEVLIPVRWTKRRNLGRNIGTKPKLVRQEEVVRTVKVKYQPDADGVYSQDGDPELNDDRINPQAAAFLDAAEQAEQIEKSATEPYNRFFDIHCDGAINQVTLSLSNGVATMQASRNNRHTPVIPSFDAVERKLAQQRSEQLEKSSKTSPILGVPLKGPAVGGLA